MYGCGIDIKVTYQLKSRRYMQRYSYSTHMIFIIFNQMQVYDFLSSYATRQIFRGTVTLFSNNFFLICKLSR